MICLTLDLLFFAFSFVLGFCCWFLWLVIAFLSGRDVNRETEVLKGHLWRGGPTAWPLATILAAGLTLPMHPINTLNKYTPYQYTLPIYPVNTPDQLILVIHTISLHPINTPYQYTQPIHTLSIHTLSIYPINIPYQHTRSTYSSNSYHIITPYQHTLSTHLSTHLLNTLSPTLSTYPLSPPPSHPTPLTPHPLTHPLSGHTKRDVSYNCDRANNKQFAHLGLGAASHMSSVAEPSAYWLKRGNGGG